jgi:hypothetical protein
MAIWRCPLCRAHPGEYTPGCVACGQRREQVVNARLGNCVDCNEVVQSHQLEANEGRCLGCSWKFTASQLERPLESAG